MNLVAFHLKTPSLFFSSARIQHSWQLSSHMSFWSIKSWYLHFIISQEGWLHFLIAEFTVNLKKWLSPGLPENLSQWKNKVVYPSSMPTPQRKIRLYLLITELYQLLQPLYCSGLDCFPCWLLVSEKINHWKNTPKKSFTDFQRIDILNTNGKFRTIIIITKEINPTFSDERLPYHTWFPTVYRYPFINITIYGALWYGACIHRHYIDEYLTDLPGWIIFLTIFNKTTAATTNPTPHHTKTQKTIERANKKKKITSSVKKHMLCFFVLNTPLLESQCPWEFLFLATVGQKAKHSCLVLCMFNPPQKFYNYVQSIQMLPIQILSLLEVEVSWIWLKPTFNSD